VFIVVILTRSARALKITLLFDVWRFAVCRARASRGTLSLNIRELEEEELIERRFVTTKPIQAYYSLTNRGKEIASHFSTIEKTLRERTVAAPQTNTIEYPSLVFL
jgi:DNA-binding HxlR family transcriptional regulator